MSSSLIHMLLQQTSAVVVGDKYAATPGSPYAREAPLTPYEYSAAVTIDLADGGRLEYLLSMPGAVLDDLATLTDAAPPERRSDERVSALAERAVEVARRAIAAAPDGAGARAEPPQIVVGCDVVLACLCTGGRRICVPWETDAGIFVVEAGLATAA